MHADHRLTAEELRKRFRVAEFLSEKIITAVAFISLTTILMIFVFVFREALPILTQGEENVPTAAAQGEVVEEETYGEEFLGNKARDLQKGTQSVEIGQDEGTASLGNLLSLSWHPISGEPKYGLVPLAIGSAKVTILSILIGGPLAILAALFTSAFAPKWAKEILKPAIEILAGFPSVVIGFSPSFSWPALCRTCSGMTFA